MTIIKKLLRNPISLIGIVILTFYVIMAIGAPWFAPIPEKSRNPYMIPRDGFSTTPSPPSEEHIFGTTEGQYDIYYGVVWGTRTAFRIGVVITLITTIIGILDDVLGWKIGLRQYEKPIITLIAVIPIAVVVSGYSTVFIPFSLRSGHNSGS